MRAFFAIALPDPLCAELAAAGRDIEGLRVQRQETIHLTVRFLGDIDDPEAYADAATAVTRLAPFELEVRGLGAFPGGSRPARVVWAGIADGAAEVCALRQVLDEALAPHVEPERREYTPHITLGRFRQPRRLAPLDADHVFAHVAVDRLTLYSSTLTPQGLERADFGSRRAHRPHFDGPGEACQRSGRTAT